MRSALIAAAAIATGMVYAGESQATQYWLATFKYPAGTFEHCFAVKVTGIYSGDGYKLSGTWTDTDFPGTAGTWLGYKNVLHFAGYVSNSPGYLVADGFKTNGTFGNAPSTTSTPADITSRPAL